MTNSRLTRIPGTDSFSEAQKYAARLEAAIVHARLTPGNFYRKLCQVYGLDISRSTVYDALGGNTKRSRYNNEFAEVCGVNPRWLEYGVGFMTDMTGRLSSKDAAVRDIKRLLRQHIIPPNRADLVREADTFIDTLANPSRDVSEQPAD